MHASTLALFFRPDQHPHVPVPGLLINHPLVADVAVLGVTDKEGNELPWAFVVRSSSAAFSSPSSSPSSEKSPSSETAGGAGGEGKAEGKGGEAQGETEEGDTKTIMEHVNSRVAGYKKIRGVTWVEKLPKR